MGGGKVKSKKIMSLVLAAGMILRGGSISTIKAYADTTNNNKIVVAQTNQKELQKKACDLIKIIENNPSAKDIKEARKLISQLNDRAFRNSYKFLVDFYTNKNLDKGISPIDIIVNACKNSRNVKSADATSNFNMNLQGNNLSNEEKEIFNSILPIINSMDITADIKLNSSENNKKVKLSGVLHFKNSLVKIDSKIWMDMDITKSIPDIKYIIEIPEGVKGFLPTSLANKKYFVFNMTTLLKDPKIAKDKDLLDINKQIQLSTMIQDKFINDFEDFIKIADANYDIVTPIDKEKLNCNSSKNIKNAYEINLNNDKLMKIIKLGLHDKNIASTFWDCVNKVADLEPDASKEKITNEQKTEVVKAFEDALDKFNKAVQCNIKSTVGIDEKGYSCYNKVTLNMVIDAKEIAKVFGAKEAPNTNSKYILTVNCDCSMSDINNNVKVAEKPEISEENSVDFSKILTDNNQI
ncbi:peptidoglycan-binding protein [Clostridium botulinum]|nr:peptidoglycan-binding protein [Clostridium botulinum]